MSRRERCGVMARVTACSTKANSRQRLGGCFDRISPGGKIACVRDEFFCEEGDEELSIEPSLRAVLVVLGEVAQFGELLEAFKKQLNLPAEAVVLQDARSRELVGRKARKDHDKLGVA